MKINKNDDVKQIDVQMDGVKDVKKRVLIGPEDNSQNIIMRLFTVAPGGHTPHHSHDFEHVVKIEKGRGIAVSEEGETEVSVGNSLFVEPNEIHQFKNPFEEDFEFLCIIPNKK